MKITCVLPVDLQVEPALVPGTVCLLPAGALPLVRELSAKVAAGVLTSEEAMFRVREYALKHAREMCLIKNIGVGGTEVPHA